MKAMAFVRLEEDQDEELGTKDRVERWNKGGQRSAQRPTPYSKPSAINAASEHPDITLASYPEIHTYNFSMSIEELVKVLEGMG